MTPGGPPDCKGSGPINGGSSSDPDVSAWELAPGRQVIIRNSPELVRAFQCVFGPFADQPRPDPTLVMEALETGNGARRLLINRLPMFSWKSAADLPPLLESVFTDYAIHARPADLAFHAAAVEINGIGVLLSGGKGCGKSTLSLWLGRHGAQYGGDEIVFLDTESERIECFPKAATIKEPVFGLFDEAETWESPVRGRLRYLLPPRVRPRFAPLSGIGLILLPDYSPGRPFSAVRLSVSETVRLLIQQGLGGLRHHPHAASRLVRLASAPACLVQYAHPEQVADFVFKVCGEGPHVA